MAVESRRVVLALPRQRCALRACASSLLSYCLLGMLASAGLQAWGQALSPQTLAKDADTAYVRGDVQEAIRLYEELIKIQPDSVEARTNLGVALAHIGRYNEAVAQYDEALKRAPDNPSILLNLALAWYKQAAFDKAAVNAPGTSQGKFQPMVVIWTVIHPDFRRGTQRGDHNVEFPVVIEVANSGAAMAARK